MKTLNEGLVDTTEEITDMRHQPPQPTDDHTPNVYRTNVTTHNKTKKWMHTFPLLKTSTEDDTASHDDNDDAAFEDSFQHASWSNKNNDGDGIQFLPGDIKGLETKLNYLLGEYRAGSRSSITRNKIVSILD